MQNQMRALRYNSEQEHLTIPEYGRHIQNLVDYAVTIEDPKEREAAAYQLIRLMAQVSNQGKPTPDIELKLWRHLFIISDYKIDVVVPEGIELPKIENKNLKPARLDYPKNTKRFRHYGGYIQQLITNALNEEDPAKRHGFFSNIASYMKTAYKVWNRDPHIGDEVIINDLTSMIAGRGELPEKLNIVAANVTISAQKPINAGLNRRRHGGGGKRKNNNNGGSNRRRKHR